MEIKLNPGESVRIRMDENYNLIWKMNPKETPGFGSCLFTAITWLVIGFGLGTLVWEWVR